MKRRELLAQQKNQDLRESYLIVVVGRKGVGKTYTTNIMLNNAVKGNKKLGIKKRRGLILDVNNEFEDVKPIAISKVKEWADFGKIELRRVTIWKAKEDIELEYLGKPLFTTPYGKMNLKEIANVLGYILDDYHDGIFLIEDINKYISDSLPNDLIGTIVTQRHKGVDIILHFQMIGKYGHPKIVANTNMLRFHKVSDEVMRHEKKFGSKLIPLLILEKLVNNRYKKATTIAEKSYFAYYDDNEINLKGRFNLKEFVEAVEGVLEDYYNKLVKPRANRMELRTGKRKYETPAQVVDEIIKEYIRDYYGNPN